MAKVKIPDWFPLPVHETAPLTYEHWMRAICFRLAIANAPQPNQWKAEKYLAVVIDDTGTTWQEPNPLDFLGIRELTPYQAFVIAGYHDNPANAAAKALAQRALKKQRAYSREEDSIRRHMPDESSDDRVWYDEFMYRIPVLVDLALDDKTLLDHFKFFLDVQRGFAKEQGIDTTLPLINEEAFQHWHKFRLLAAYDLLTWREVSGARYTDAQIAASLWPDIGPMAEGAFVDRAERFRKVTKPLVEKIMTFYTVERLERQWEWDLMRARLKAERNKNQAS
jgi:hypothetical protein